MDIYSRKRNSVLTFLVVGSFVFGLLIGFALCYAIFADRGATPPIQQAMAPPDEPAPAEPPVEPVEPAVESPPPPVDTAPPPPEPAGIDDLEDTWAARHFFVAVKGAKLDDKTRDMLAELKPGGVVLSASNVKNKIQTIPFIKSIKEAVGLGKDIDSLPLIAVAQEGGKLNVLNLPPAEAPSAAAIGERRDLEYARGAGLETAKSLESRGIGILLAPVLDVFANGAPDAMKDRTFGADYTTVRALALAYAEGVTQGNVIPVAKHFPGRGAEGGDGVSALATLPDSPAQTEIVFPFMEAAGHEVPGLLVGHVAAPGLDKEFPQRPASLSPELIQKLVRDKWQYKGVIIADDLTAPAIADSMKVEDAAVQAFAAGCDAVLLLDGDPDRVRAVAAAVDAAAAAGTLDRRLLSEGKMRLDAWQQWLRKPVPGLKGGVPELPPLEVAVEPGTEEAPPAVPAAQQTHTVAKGDTLYKVAATYKVTVQQIKDWNKLKSDTLRVGQKLIVGAEPAPAPAPAPAPEPAPEPPAEPAPTPAPAEETPPAAPAPADGTPAPAGEPAATAPETAAPAPAEGTAPATEPPAAPESAQPPADVPAEEAAAAAPTEGQPANTKAVKHKVKAGEFLATIASEYGVTYQSIMEWNGLTKTEIYAGQELKLFVPADAAAPAPAPAAPAAADSPATYTVQSGDFLGKIAEKHGVTVKQLMDWNGLKSIDLKVGQVLKVKE
ncbi:MAG: LysM peptidoglycan-binding domain-containing protein [Candidatus Hydrogenedentes bacterium]|nr:LysM peptidoglycan-binding domain-containing protein [Candidatus Hydrogenedentota bacterium]